MLPLLAACSSVGFGAPTGEVYIPAVGTNDRSGSVDVLNALVVSGQDGTGTLIATFVDNKQDTADSLTGVTGDNLVVTPSTFTLPAGIPVGGHLSLADHAPIAVSGQDVAAGNFITLTFTFATGEPATLQVPVVANTYEFADIQLPSTGASATATPTATTE
jgi:hypothetical protein